MSSLDISELTGKTHGHVKRDIEQMLSGLELDVSSFGRIYRDAMNRKQEEYLLPKDLTLTLVTGYDVKRRHAINKRWIAWTLTKRVSVQLTPLAASSDLWRRMCPMRLDTVAQMT